MLIGAIVAPVAIAAVSFHSTNVDTDFRRAG
jgi:hypothetical protein